MGARGSDWAKRSSAPLITQMEAVVALAMVILLLLAPCPSSSSRKLPRSCVDTSAYSWPELLYKVYLSAPKSLSYGEAKVEAAAC